MADAEELAARVAALEAALSSTTDLVAAFDSELRGLGQSLVLTGREMDTLSRGIGTGLRRAFDGLVFDGLRASDAMRMVSRSMVDGVYSMAMRPVQNAFGAAIARGIAGFGQALMPFAQGAAFAQGRVAPFAAGGIVTAPTMFPMRGGTGLMGEAGPEAVLPLARGADGRLGVRAGAGSGDGPVSVTIHVATPDVEGFRRSQTQIAAEVARVLDRAGRNR